MIRGRLPRRQSLETGINQQLSPLHLHHLVASSPMIFLQVLSTDMRRRGMTFLMVVQPWLLKDSLKGDVGHVQPRFPCGLTTVAMKQVDSRGCQPPSLRAVHKRRDLLHRLQMVATLSRLRRGP